MLKKGEPEGATNYFPVGKTPGVCKVLEIMLIQAILDFLIKFNYRLTEWFLSLSQLQKDGRRCHCWCDIFALLRPSTMSSTGSCLHNLIPLAWVKRSSDRYDFSWWEEPTEREWLGTWSKRLVSRVEHPKGNCYLSTTPLPTQLSMDDVTAVKSLFLNTLIQRFSSSILYDPLRPHSTALYKFFINI